MFQPPKMPDKKAMVVQKGGAAVGCSAGLFVWPGPRAARQRNPQAEEDPCLPESMLAFPAAFSSTSVDGVHPLLVGAAIVIGCHPVERPIECEGASTSSR